MSNGFLSRARDQCRRAGESRPPASLSRKKLAKRLRLGVSRAKRGMPTSDLHRHL